MNVTVSPVRLGLPHVSRMQSLSSLADKSVPHFSGKAAPFLTEKPVAEETAEVVLFERLWDGVQGFLRLGQKDRVQFYAKDLFQKYTDKGEFADALRWARKAGRLEPGNANLRNRSGEACLGWAIDKIRLEMDLPVSGTPAYKARLQSKPESFFTEAARAFFEEAKKVAPKDARPLVGLARLASLQGNPQETITHAWNAVNLDPHQIKAYLLLGKALLKQGRVDEAVHAFRVAKFVGKTPDEVAQGRNALHSLFEVKLKQLQADRQFSTPGSELAFYREVVEQMPDHPDLNRKLAQLAEEAGEMAVIVEALKRLMQLEVERLNFAEISPKNTIKAKVTDDLGLGDDALFK